MKFADATLTKSLVIDYYYLDGMYASKYLKCMRKCERDDYNKNIS